MGKPLGVTPAGGGSGFGVSYSAGIGWLKSFRETGSAARGQMGGHRPKTISGEHQDWLVQRCRERDFTLRRLVGEPAERGRWTIVRYGRSSMPKSCCTKKDADRGRTGPPRRGSGERSG